MFLVDITHPTDLMVSTVSLGERFFGLGNPNYHGVLAATGLMFASYLGRDRLGVPSFVRALLLGLFWLNLWAPKSRGSWMALAIYAAVFSLLQPFRYKKVVAVLVLAVTPLAYALRPSADALGTAGAGLRLDSESVSGRSDVTFEALDIDNSYLCMMLETGFWGLGVFAIFIVRTLSRGLRTCLSAENSAVLRDYRWAFAVFVALVAHSMFESIIMSGLQLGSLLFLFCAALLNRPLTSRIPEPAYNSAPSALTGPQIVPA
jgi:hypothetical protein